MELVVFFFWRMSGRPHNSMDEVLQPDFCVAAVGSSDLSNHGAEAGGLWIGSV